MDFACSLQPPNGFQTGLGTTGYRISDVLANPRIRNQGFGGYNGFNTLALSKAQSRRNLKSVGCSSCFRPHLVNKWKIDCVLRGKCFNKLFCSYDDGLKLSRGVRLRCQGNDSLAYIDGNGRNVEYVEGGDESLNGGPADGVESDGLGGKEEAIEGKDAETPSLDELRELLAKAINELEVARLNSTMFEDKAQRISEAAIALKDNAEHAWDDVNITLNVIQEIVNEECDAKEAVQKATMALSLAEARLQVVLESIQGVKGEGDSMGSLKESDIANVDREDDEVLLAAQIDIRECKANLASCEAEWKRLQNKKEELQKEVDRLNEVAEKAQMDALKAEEEVANIMLLAEQAVAFELEATQRVNDAEIALKRAEKSIFVDVSEITKGYISSDEVMVEEKTGFNDDGDIESEGDMSVSGNYLVSESPSDVLYDQTNQEYEALSQDEMSDQENGKLSFDSSKEIELEADKLKTVQTKKQETQKDLTREGSSLSSPKQLLKKSSRFFSASFFSFAVDGTEFTPASVFQGLVESTRKQLPTLVLGFFLLGAGYVILFLFLLIEITVVHLISHCFPYDGMEVTQVCTISFLS